MLKKQKIVYTCPHACGYFNIFKYDNQMYMVYRHVLDEHRKKKLNKCGKDIQKTSVAKSPDGIETFKVVDDILVSQFAASHNFTPVLSNETGVDTFYGIGGIQCIDYDKHWCNKVEKWYNGKLTMDPEYENKCRINGLYLYESNNLEKDWKLSKNIPVLTGMQEGQFDGLHKITHFDGRITCFFSKIRNKYVIYVRSNVRRNCRWVQMAESDDLLTWSKFTLLNVSPGILRDQNFYFMDVAEIGDTFVGVAPYTDCKNTHFIMLLMSQDGINWTRCGKLAEAPNGGTIRNGVHPCSNILSDMTDENKSMVYLQDNYYGIFNHRQHSNIERHEIEKDRFISISSVDNKVGNFKIDNYNMKQELPFNYKTHNDGYIKLKINNTQTIEIVGGNDFKKVIGVNSENKNKTCDIEIEIFKSEIFRMDTC
jgi:hypothetical protein